MVTQVIKNTITKIKSALGKTDTSFKHSDDPALKKPEGHKLPSVKKLETPLEPESTPTPPEQTHTGKMNPQPTIDELMAIAETEKAKLDAAAPPAQVAPTAWNITSRKVPSLAPPQSRSQGRG